MAQQPPAPEVYDDSPEAGFGSETANTFRKMLDLSEVTQFLTFSWDIPEISYIIRYKNSLYFFII